jgi:alpha-1,2-mannosyltransferase
MTSDHPPANDDATRPSGGPLARLWRHVSTRERWIEAGTVRSAWLAWALLIVGVSLVVALKSNPNSNTVTHNYREAALAWVRAEPMYSPGADGWLYPPQSAIVFVPFALLGDTGRVGLVASEIAWRAMSAALLAWAVWSVANLVRSRGYAEWFFPMTLLTIPGTLGALNNGQTNVALGAAMVLAFVALGERRWWWACAWLALGLALKPLGLVAVLLAGALFVGAMWWRLGLTLLAFAASPMLHLNWTYALDQYRQGLAKVLEAGAFAGRRFADLGGMLETLGVRPAPIVLTSIRAASAVLTLVLCWAALRRLGREWGSVVCAASASAYLVLMNPRTEGNSYVLIAPAVAALACFFLLSDRPPGRPRLGWVLVVVALLLGIAHLLNPWDTKDYVLRPLGAIVLAGVCVWMVSMGRGLVGLTPQNLGTTR